jgi:hypothetical protein
MGTDDVRPLSGGPPLDIQPGGVEVVAVQVPAVDAPWRFGVRVSPDGPRVWFSDWLGSDLDWSVSSWAPDGLYRPPSIAVWSQLIEP